MKKKISLLAITAVIMTTGIFAKPIEPGVNDKVLVAFTKHFEGVKDITWNKTEQYIKANFVKDGQPLSAYFNSNGELIGVSKNILSQQLPLKLNLELKKVIADGWITELFEFTDGQTTTYFMTVENSNQKVHYQNDGYEWTVYKKVKKS
jgi:hypothetical protein